MLTGDRVRDGDVLLGLASSGLHSNGFSLVRKVVEAQGLDYGAPAPFESGRGLGEALLEPTRIYVKSCLPAIRGGGVHALAHITGGGLLENVPRVLPEGLAARLDASAWTVPPVFRWLAGAGGIAEQDMLRTFNCGIGMVVVVAEHAADSVAETLRGGGETVHVVGRVVARGDGPAVVVGDEA